VKLHHCPTPIFYYPKDILEQKNMKFLYNWLKKLLSLKQTEEKIAEDQVARSFENIVIGKILEINKHPNADRLRLVKVDIGREIMEIVCGATNIAVGQKVPVALLGAKFPGGIEIKEASIRGIKSCGMLCAEDELGISQDHSGIMLLNEKAEIGMEFAEYINLK
jgi:phenylalanyl-tRNA synthetase beta chain